MPVRARRGARYVRHQRRFYAATSVQRWLRSTEFDVIRRVWFFCG